MLNKLILLSSALLLVYACTNKNGEDPVKPIEPAVCDTTNVTFSGTVHPIITANCNGCHSGNRPSGGRDFTTHQGITAAVNDGLLLGTIRHESGFIAMPKNAAKLSSCNITIIEKWVIAGMPNN